MRLELDNGEGVRRQTLGLGTAVGEPGMYLQRASEWKQPSKYASEAR